MLKELQGAQDTLQATMGYGFQVGQTEVREHRFFRMPSMGVCEFGRQPQFVLIKCFQSNDSYLYQLTARFGPWKTVGPTFGPSCVFLATTLASRNKGVNCG